MLFARSHEDGTQLRSTSPATWSASRSAGLKSRTGWNTLKLRGPTARCSPGAARPACTRPSYFPCGPNAFVAGPRTTEPFCSVVWKENVYATPVSTGEEPSGGADDASQLRGAVAALGRIPSSKCQIPNNRTQIPIRTSRTKRKEPRAKRLTRASFRDCSDSVWYDPIVWNLVLELGIPRFASVGVPHHDRAGFPPAARRTRPGRRERMTRPIGHWKFVRSLPVATSHNRTSGRKLPVPPKPSGLNATDVTIPLCPSHAASCFLAMSVDFERPSTVRREVCRRGKCDAGLLAVCGVRRDCRGGVHTLTFLCPVATPRVSSGHTAPPARRSLSKNGSRVVRTTGSTTPAPPRPFDRSPVPRRSSWRRASPGIRRRGVRRRTCPRCSCNVPPKACPNGHAPQSGRCAMAWIAGVFSPFAHGGSPVRLPNSNARLVPARQPCPVRAERQRVDDDLWSWSQHGNTNLPANRAVGSPAGALS